MRKRFHNTIGARGQMLFDFEASVEKQEMVIMNYMKTHCSESFTPIQLWDRLNKLGYNYPLTSIRRALSNRTDTGELTMHEEKKNEMYGKPNHLWQFKVN